MHSPEAPSTPPDQTGPTPASAVPDPRAPDPPAPDDQATLLLAAAAEGDRAAADRLLPLVYDQLRRAAERQVGAEADQHTLSATALVHEAYLRLIGPRRVPWAGRAHFYASAAQAMRRLLIDRARARRARGGRPVPLHDIADVGKLADAGEEQIVAVDAAVSRLEDEDPQAGALVRLRFYAGLSVDQAAEVIGVSPRTAARLWAYARAVLYRQLRGGDDDGGARP